MMVETKLRVPPWLAIATMVKVHHDVFSKCFLDVFSRENVTKVVFLSFLVKAVLFLLFRLRLLLVVVEYHFIIILLPLVDVER